MSEETDKKSTISKTHVWEQLKRNSYGSQYRCLQCGEFCEIHHEENTICFPPVMACTGRAGS